jgi:hypothetical protein
LARVAAASRHADATRPTLISDRGEDRMIAHGWIIVFYSVSSGTIHFPTPDGLFSSEATCDKQIDRDQSLDRNTVWGCLEIGIHMPPEWNSPKSNEKVKP